MSTVKVIFLDIVGHSCGCGNSDAHRLTMEKIMEYRVVVTKDFTKWYKHGTDLLHREDGPAVEHAYGSKSWYKEGKLHREGGPACEYANGS
jgi:hypothetical protein